jgi:DNA primase
VSIPRRKPHPYYVVSPEKRLWNCYRCQKGGDHVSFIQDIKHVDVKGGLRVLAEKRGVVPEESPSADEHRELVALGRREIGDTTRRAPTPFRERT